MGWWTVLGQQMHLDQVLSKVQALLCMLVQQHAVEPLTPGAAIHHLRRVDTLHQSWMQISVVMLIWKLPVNPAGRCNAW